ncbi:hypothetical protein O3P69_016838 [Scylla paramamosain]|uniref:Uncharacterized protein n=1 Tax=Scylla paramamosain TaxID=85552 RepID=A0AAW0T0I2_SCYPA
MSSPVRLRVPSAVLDSEGAAGGPALTFGPPPLKLTDSRTPPRLVSLAVVWRPRLAEWLVLVMVVVVEAAGHARNGWRGGVWKWMKVDGGEET